jgi:hypothetical protein
VAGNAVTFDLYIRTSNSNDTLFLATSSWGWFFNNINFSSPTFEIIPGFTTNLISRTGFDVGDVFYNVTAEVVNGNKISGYGLATLPTTIAQFNQRVARITNQPNFHRLGRYKLSTIINPGGSLGLIWWFPMTDIWGYKTDGSFNTEQLVNGTYPDINNPPLPIQLVSFSHSVAKNNITLNWKTSKEINNKEFIVERKTANSEVWNSSGIVEGKGNTNTTTEYSFTDRNLQTGKYNYRLKQADYNGNFEYHNLNNIVEVGVPDKFELSQNYPNPFNPTTKIDYQLPFDSKVDIRLYDVTGREVKTLINENSKAGYYSFEFNANQLSSGIYFYRIISKSNAKDFVMTKKMMLIK